MTSPNKCELHRRKATAVDMSQRTEFSVNLSGMTDRYGSFHVRVVSDRCDFLSRIASTSCTLEVPTAVVALQKLDQHELCLLNPFEQAPDNEPSSCRIA